MMKFLNFEIFSFLEIQSKFKTCQKLDFALVPTTQDKLMLRNINMCSMTHATLVCMKYYENNMVNHIGNTDMCEHQINNAKQMLIGL